MLKWVNRIAIIVTPKQPLIDWVNKVFPEDPILNFFDSKNDNSNVYLLSDDFDMEEIENYLIKNYKQIFHHELFEWCEDESLFPNKITFKLFNNWFDFSIQTMVFDLSAGQIEKEDAY
jgi:hypothetical protein